MNRKLIAKYHLQAEKYAHDLLGFCGHDDYNKVRNEKFADLIINECLDIIDEEGCCEAGAISASKRIKKELLFGK